MTAGLRYLVFGPVLRRGQEVKIAGAGHLNIVEHPVGTARAIAGFIAAVRRPG